MRMGIGLLIGILVILLGIGIIINVVFHVNIPIFKILVGVFVIYIGLKIILGGFSCTDVHWNHNRNQEWHGKDGNVVFGNRTYRDTNAERKEYSTVFGKSLVDFRGMELKEKVTRVKVSTVFGNTEVILDKNMPVRVNAEAVFGKVSPPENSTGAFGTTYYQSKNFDENANYLLIDAECVFGDVNIHY